LEKADGTVVREFEPKEIRRVCSEHTVKRLTDMMRWVVEKGTGTAVALPNYDIAGKTGTAYKFMGKQYSKYNYVSSFVGFVPAEDPKFAIYVSLDDPRGLYWGGYTAGPVFKEVAKRAMAYDLVPPSVPEVKPVLAAAPPVVPSFLGLTPVQCQWLAEQSGLTVKFGGKGERVTDQSLKAGPWSPASDSPRILLTLGVPPAPGENGVMPDLRGKTKRQALSLLAPLGVKVNFRGQGVVQSQFPLAGRSVQAAGACDLNCDFPITSADTTPGGHS
jgi:stage V sporulation protein D (sporulation-specific penicillin-binding protein)